jgi:hypothetical protein
MIRIAKLDAPLTLSELRNPRSSTRRVTASPINLAPEEGHRWSGG